MKKQIERIIHLDDMLLYILEQWKILIAGGIIVGLIFGSLGVVKVNKKYTTIAETGESAGKEINVSGSELMNIDTILYLEKAIKNQKKYNANSMLMKIDPYKKKVASVKYQFQVVDDADFELSANEVAQAVKTYQNILGNKEIFDYIKKLSLIENDDACYLKELISVETDSLGTVVVNVSASDEKTACDLREGIKEYLLEKNKKVLERYKYLSVKMESESINTVIDISLQNHQTAQYNNLQNLRSMMEARRLDLSDEAKQYLELAKKESKEGNYKSGQPLYTETDYQEAGEAKKLYEAGVYAFKWLALFGCLYIIWFGTRYMWSAKLMYVYDLWEMNGIRVVEVLSGIDSDMIYISTEKIAACLVDDSNDVLFISSDMAQMDTGILESLKAALVKRDISVEFVSSMNNVKMINCVKNSKNIIIVESIGQSKYSRIKKCIDDVYCLNKEFACALIIKTGKR